jgi:hypothetical protein
VRRLKPDNDLLALMHDRTDDILEIKADTPGIPWGVDAVDDRNEKTKAWEGKIV